MKRFLLLLPFVLATGAAAAPVRLHSLLDLTTSTRGDALTANWDNPHESNFDPYAVSDRGACGILQLIPATAKRFGVGRVFDAGQNIEGGAKYLRFLLDRFDGRLDLALAGYNAGEGSVDRHGGIPPYRETRAYVAGVLREIQASQPAP